MTSLEDWYRRRSQDIEDERSRKLAAAWRALGSAARADGGAQNVRSNALLEGLTSVGEGLIRSEEAERELATQEQELLRGLGGQVVGAYRDFRKNFDDMREANTIGADKYFHCKANCEAARRGPVGSAVAAVISNGRELTDLLRKGPNFKDMKADEAANHRGRNGGARHLERSCGEICAVHRPKALNPRYP